MTKNKISKQTLRFFSDSGLKKSHAEKMRISDVTSQEMKKLFSKMKFIGEDLSGHEMPYFDLDGAPINYTRYRLHDDDDGSLPKYLQVTGKKSRFYFPPFVNWREIAEAPSMPIYITEGERKAAKACVEGFNCIGIGGVWNWLSKTKEDKSQSLAIKDFQLIEWKGRTVIIVFDSDSLFNSNIQHAIKKLRDKFVELGADPYRIDLPHEAGNNKVGLDDFLKKRNGKKAFEKLDRIPLFLNKTMTAKQLVNTKYDPTRWIVKGLIPTGLTIFAGPPKVGKSWLVLGIVLAAASGKRVFEHYETDKMHCLYLALEDSPRRLKDRILKLSEAGYSVNEFAHFAYEWERVCDGGLLALERRLDKIPECKVVFIDTFEKVRAPKNNRQDTYHQDYEAVGALKRIADKRGIGIVVIHHTNKGEKADFLESVSGTMGITGAADTIIVLRRDRNAEEGTIEVTGRDVGEQAIAVNFDEGNWIYKGEAHVVRATAVQEEILELMKEEDKPLRLSELARLAGRKAGGFKKTLDRMEKAGLIVRKNLLYSVAEEKSQKPKKFAKDAKGKDKG